MTLAYSYTNTVKNFSCWTCDHFQRFEQSPPFTICQGQCRFAPPRLYAVLSDEWNEPEPVPEHWIGFAPWFPSVCDAPRSWCSQWERTQEKNLPDPPSRSICEPAEPGHIIIDWQWTAWTKKADLNVHCWNCDHFQKDPYGIGGSSGECRKNPLEAGGTAWWVPGYFNGNVLQDMTTYFAWFWLDANKYWCSQWERARHVVSPVPPPLVALKSLSGKAQMMEAFKIRFTKMQKKIQ